MLGQGIYLTDGTLSVRYEVRYSTFFEVDGDLTKFLEVNGNLNYIMYWLKSRLIKLESGEIKVVTKSSAGNYERDWEREEKIRKGLWNDIKTTERTISFLKNNPNGMSIEGIEFVCSFPTGMVVDEGLIICTVPLQQYTTSVEQRSANHGCSIS